MRRPALLLGSLAAALACARGDADRSDAEAAVRAYDDSLVRAYRTNDPAPVRATATAKEAGRVQVLVDLKVAGRLVLESTLERLEILSADRVGPDGFTARTAERWRYQDRPIDPGRAAGPEFVAEMKMEYDVAREDGRWRVAKVRTLSNEYLKQPAGAPGAGAAAR